jgi:ATP-binding cassette subfamily C (CFTR/MRP) protein 1
MQTVLLILHAINSTLRTRATLTAASFSLVDALGLCVLSHTEHIHSVRPSAIINAYLLLTLPFDVARTRTLWINDATTSVAAVFSSTLAVKVIILIAEGMEKRGILLDRYRYSSPEVTSGIYARSFFWWLNNLMTSGMQRIPLHQNWLIQIGFQRVISNEDLYPIDDEMTSSSLQENAQKIWGATDKSKPRALLWSTLKASRKALAYCILPRLFLIGFRYAQPFLLSRTVNFASNQDEPDSIGWGLTAAFGFVFLGLAVANGSYYHMTYRFVTSVRGILVSMIYTKTVDLSITALDESAAVTLMASDTETICQGFTNLNEVWAVPIELAIALYLLDRQLGIAFLAPAALSILATVGIIMIAKYIGNAQKIWIEGIQTRVDVTANFLGSMKVGFCYLLKMTYMAN